MKKSNLWTQGSPKEVVRGVVAWENCLEVPEGIIDSMNEDVDQWKIEQDSGTKQSEATKSLYNANGPIRFDPEQEFRKIYKFLDEPYFNHRFNNLDQVSVNGLSYDDRVVGSNMHKLFDGPVRKVYNPYIEKIPKRIREKYEHIRF